MKYLVILFVLLLSACGGRVSNIVPETTNVDSMLTCSHLKGEYEINFDKMNDITKEKGAQETNNVGLLLAAPFLLDFSDTETKEVFALQKRNQKLEQLLLEKNCPAISQHTP